MNQNVKQLRAPFKAWSLWYREQSGLAVCQRSRVAEKWNPGIRWSQKIVSPPQKKTSPKRDFFTTTVAYNWNKWQIRVKPDQPRLDGYVQIRAWCSTYNWTILFSWNRIKVWYVCKRQDPPGLLMVYRGCLALTQRYLLGFVKMKRKKYTTCRRPLNLSKCADCSTNTITIQKNNKNIFWWLNK